MIKLLLHPYRFCLMTDAEGLTSLLRAVDTTKPEAEEQMPETFWLDFYLEICLGLCGSLYIMLF